MVDDSFQLIQLILSFGFGSAITILLVAYLLTHPIILFKVFNFIVVSIHKIFGFWKKTAIKSQIETHINDGIQLLSDEIPSAFIRAFKLEWISSSEDYSTLKDGSVIVRIKHDHNLVKPIVDSTILYLQSGLIPESRQFIEKRIITAIELVLAYRILKNSPQMNATNYLMNNYIEPALKDSITEEYFEKADRSDQAGILTRIILREFSGYASKLKGSRPNRSIRYESKNFFEFASRFVERNNEIPLRFFGNYFRCTIALIARTETYERSGLLVYQRNFKRDIDLGVQVIYLLSKGSLNTQVARHIAKWANDEGLIAGSIPDHFLISNSTGELSPAECIVCFSSKVGRSVQLSPLEEAQIAIARIIPESLTGEIDIVSIAREPQKTTKILISSEKYENPIKICKGENDERLKLLIQEMGESEIIDFIKVCPNIKDTVISALTPLDPRDVDLVQLALDGREIRIVVKSAAAAHRAVGTDGINLSLAKKLIGVNIQLDTRENEISPEQEVMDILNYLVPQIKSKQIEVVKMARRVGRITKIAVYSASIPNLHKIFFKRENPISKDISVDLGGEHVHIIIWDPLNPKKNVIESLYPLRNQEVSKIEIDDANQSANVYVLRDEVLQYAIGKDGDNVRLAESICNMRIKIIGPNNNL